MKYLGIMKDCNQPDVIKSIQDNQLMNELINNKFDYFNNKIVRILQTSKENNYDKKNNAI